MISIISTTIAKTTYLQQTNSKNALIDSGTGMMLIDNESYNDFISIQSINENCKYSTSSSIYFCCCEKSLPQIQFNLPNNNQLLIESENYLSPMQGGLCILAVSSQINENYMIFGDVLMRNYFVAYNKSGNTMGFSLPKENKNKLFLK
eukprot:TRINITY_DN8047_c0_g1_i1.p2 TRINITY_DN8047_c0_g1~~TRINITY_DN8047_c0_g1_i1.p2  ORF type:complete len:148 (+),score=31.63 TRINITY_DN8047_c0_g1_i1:545-988(+)